MTKNFETIPEPLKKYPFCVWKLETRNGKPTKVPYNPMTGEKAQPNNPETFSNFDVATMAALDYDGIGVGIFGDLAAIDLDHCLYPEGGVAEWAQDIVNTMRSYTEVSPSAQGLRLLFPVTQPFAYDKTLCYINRRLNRETGEGIEVYVAGVTKKYVTVTGDLFPLPFATPWEPRNQELREVLEKYMLREQPKQTSHVPQGPNFVQSQTGVRTQPSAQSQKMADDALLKKAAEARNGEDFKRLYKGDWSGYPSQSEADLALLSMLAFWTGGDPVRMDRLFRRSRLMREKWDRPQSGSTYGAQSIQRAIALCQKVYEPRREAAGLESPPPVKEVIPEEGKGQVLIRAGRLTLTRASDVPYEEPHWVIKPYLQAGKGTLIQGDNGVGKTAFVCALAAQVSSGAPFLSISVDDPGTVLVCSVEDEQSVLRGRIEENGGNLERCVLINETSGLTITSPDLEKAIKAVSAKLLIIDPLQAFLGANVDMNRANETRPVLAALFEMCKRNGCACIIIAHTGKASGDKSPVNRSLGSVDIPAAMRSIIHIMEHPEDENERVAVHVKSSNARNGKTLHYRIVDRGGVQWTELSELREADFARIARRKEREQLGIVYENEPLVQVFNALMTARPGGGFWSYAELAEEGSKILGFPPYQDLRDLRYKIDGLARDLLQKDGLIVTHGQKGRANKSGIRIQRYRQPEGYQTSLEGVG